MKQPEVYPVTVINHKTKSYFRRKKKVGDEAAAPNNVQLKHTSVFLEGN